MATALKLRFAALMITAEFHPVFSTFLVFALAFVLRAVNVDTSYELHVDEFTYARLGASVATGELPNLSGTNFFLHPPAFFILVALFEFFLDAGSNSETAVFNLRWINVALGAATASALMLIGRQMGSTTVGILAAAIFSLDPFIVRQNSRVFLDTATIAWVAITWLMASRLYSRGQYRPASWFGIGLVGGLAILTKDMAAFLIILPPALLILFARQIRMQTLLAAGAGAVLPYLVWILVVISTGNWSVFWLSKSSGLARLFGAEQSTGYNVGAGTPSAVDAFVEQGLYYGPSYIIMAAGSSFGIWLLWRGPSLPLRFVGAVNSSAVVMISYAMVFGTFEEQFLYFLIVPAIMACVLGASVLRMVKFSAAIRTGLVFLFGMIIVWSTAVWTTLHLLERDSAWAPMLSYVRANLAPSDAVVVTSLDKFALTEFDRGDWYTAEALRERDVQYAILPSNLIEQRYTEITPDQADFIESHGEVIYTTQSRTLGELVLIKLDRDSISSKPPVGQ
ncbi:glycosyltransferase family 39 protein [Kocuria sp. CPCC 205292]|uniref:ArnT family glycosyltransferase n=1 Tax=Kocuria cellulosilytica TaxID=3071451 RepID=UPI0034D76709